MSLRSCWIASGVTFIAAFLGRNGRRGFGEVLDAVEEAGLVFWASPSRTLTWDDSCCEEVFGFSGGRGNSAEIEVSWPPELRGGGKDEGRVCGR